MATRRVPTIGITPHPASGHTPAPTRGIPYAAPCRRAYAARGAEEPAQRRVLLGIGAGWEFQPSNARGPVHAERRVSQSEIRQIRETDLRPASPPRTP